MTETIIKIGAGVLLAAAGVSITVAVVKANSKKKADDVEVLDPADDTVKEVSEDSKSTVFTFVPEEETRAPKFTTVTE